MPIRAVIFDWDLTLWNSWDIHLLLMARTAHELGVPTPAPADIAAEFHRPFLRHLLHFLGSRPDADEDEIPRIEAVYLQHYYALAGHRNYLYPGVASLLRILKQRGFRIGILSDKRVAFGDPELAQSGLAPLVDCATFQTGAHPYKPHPAGLRHTLAMLDAAPSDALYLGDAPQDIACARAAGTIAIAALWATIDRDAMLDLQPDYALHRPHQLLAALADLDDLTDAVADASPSRHWRRHLPGPWRPDADNPDDDQDATPTTPQAILSAATPSVPPDLAGDFSPLAARWRGRSRQLQLPPHAANPVAPLNPRPVNRNPADG